MLTPQEKYRSTELYRTLVSTGSITPSSSHEKYRFIPNHVSVGTTWDARHLDKFISNPKYGTTPLSRPNTTVRAAELMKTTSNKSASTLRPLKSQGSHYFRTGSRFTDDREKEYLINYSNNFTIKEAKKNTNNLVTNSQVDPVGLEKYCRREFTPLNPHFDPQKLEFSVQGNPLVTPESRRQQLKEIKTNQVELSKWKEKKKEIVKKYRVYKNGFKSGIMGIDNPNYDETILYQEEHEAIAKMKKHNEEIEKRRLDQLQTWTKTDPMLEFFNRNFDKRTSLPLRQIVPKNARNGVNMDHTKSWRDTSDRLFGFREEPHSVERATYLKSQETKGRNWDIISFSKNTVPSKALEDTLN